MSAAEGLQVLNDSTMALEAYIKSKGADNVPSSVASLASLKAAANNVDPEAPGSL